MYKVLITGGSGFIGTNLIKDLISSNYTVLNLDIASPLNSAHQPYWQEVNILDEDKLQSAAEKFNPDFIIHLAAVTDLNGKDLAYYNTNIQGTQHMINVASRLPSLKKIIYTSSMYVCKPGNIPPDFDTYTPHTLYGESKAIGEQLVKNVVNTAHEWMIIRPTSIWGPWFNIPYIDFFNTVYQGRYFDFGKSCTKTYGYVGNTVFQIKKLMHSPVVHQKTYYLGDDPPIHIAKWGDEISVALGKGNIKSIPFALIKAAALTGDILTKLGIKFPMTSFRLSNMTTNNIFSLKDLYQITGSTPYSRQEGTDNTIQWLVQHKGYQINNTTQGVSPVV